MKYTVEMSYGLGASVQVEAENKEDAIKTAQEKVWEGISIQNRFDGVSGLEFGFEFEQVTFVGEGC